MSPLARPLAFAFVSLHVCTAVHADVRHVGTTGHPYTSIQAAVDASASGDVILVHAGTYAGFHASGKAITVSADTDASVQLVGASVVTGVPVGHVAVVAGLRMRGADAQCPSSAPAEALFVLNNAGMVMIQACTIDGGNADGGGYMQYPPACANASMALQVVDASGGVVFVDSLVRASSPTSAGTGSYGCCPGFSQYPAPSAIGALVRDARTAWMSCEVRGGRGAAASDGAPGRDALSLQATLPGCGLFSLSSRFIGGNGGNALEDTFESYGGAGGNGISAGITTHLHLFGSVLQGGIGGGAMYPAAVAPSGVGLTGAPSTYQYTGAPLVIRAPSVAHVGSTIEFRAQGTPGTVVKLFASTQARFHYVPSWRGVLVPTTAASDSGMTMGTIPASGVLTVPYTVPQLSSGVPSRNLFVQAYRSDSAGGWALSDARCVTVVP